MHESKPPLPLLPSSTPRCPSPAAHRGNGRPLFTKRVASGSPLRTMETSRDSPSQLRPVLSARASTVSRTSTLPASPLDDIPEKLWPRVLRTSSTPETSNPELSIDEITSTRLSLDDQDILTNTPKEGDRREAHSRKLVVRTALSGMWGENSERLKKMTKRLRRLPDGIFTHGNREPREREMTAMMNPAPLREPKLPCLDLLTELCVPTTGRMPSIEESEGVDPLELEMDYECKPKESESGSDEKSKISSLIRKDLHEVSSGGLLLRPSSAGNAERPARHYKTVPTYTYAASSTTINSSHTAVDRLLHGPRSLRSSTRQGTGRTSSIGSVEEMRSHAFGSRRFSRPSLSSVSFRHSYAPSISRSSQSASRPGTNGGSASSYNGPSAPRRPMVYMDVPSHSTNFTWTGLDSPEHSSTASTASTARPLSRAISVPNSRDGHADASASLLPEIGPGLGDLPGYIKVPICAPRRIERTHGSRRVEQNPPALPSSLTKPRSCSDDPSKIDCLSRSNNASPSASEASFGSIQGQTSILSQLEREALLHESDSDLERDPCSGGRDRLSRAFSMVWPKGCRRRTG